ncbi:hypothetical protein Goklo_004940, partial [Gossypium klotzschianum]|nr:hypothetical protein [Gossypium klotzschianum]
MVDISRFIQGYIKEIQGVKEKGVTKKVIYAKRKPPSRTCIKLNFGITFDKDFFKSGMGIVARNVQGKVVTSCLNIPLKCGLSICSRSLACSWAVKRVLSLGLH